jgi:branched-chain amino acid aminotransferase
VGAPTTASAAVDQSLPGTTVPLAGIPPGAGARRGTAAPRPPSLPACTPEAPAGVPPDEEHAVSANAPAFGSVFAPTMAVARAVDGVYGDAEVVPVEDLRLHPAAHVLHYCSACFEGLKAHRGSDDVVRIFRGARHVERMRRSAQVLRLPVPPAELLHGMLRTIVAANLDLVPEQPGSLYLRPTLIGTLPNIGAAASPSPDALLYVLPSPVGDYFAGGVRPLRLLVEEELPRSTPQFGQVKSGANYAMALGPTLDAKAEHGVDQVLFAPTGKVTETGAANLLLIDGDHVVTPELDGSLLPGVTRDSILQLARDSGRKVEEAQLDMDEVVAWAEAGGEAALSGTAAVLAPVGTLLWADGREVAFNGGEVGDNVLELRDALTAMHRGEAEDVHGWLEVVD